jgi:hypothetical protein
MCNRTFQRADVRALHLKKCQGPPSDMSGGQGPPRKRVRHACNRCRQKKIACNGRVPCSQCWESPSGCEYATQRDLGDGSLGNAQLITQRASFDGGQTHSADDNSLMLDQGTQQVDFLPPTETETPLVVPDEVMLDELDLPMAAGDMFDSWHIPTFV